MNPLVSVIIPTYERNNNKSELLLKRSISSVFNQNYPNLEIIIIIDGTSRIIIDMLEKLSKEYEFPIQVYESGRKVGAASTRNIGIRNSSGKWIAFLDDDDEWCKDKLSTQIFHVENNSNENEKVFSFSLINRGGVVFPRRKWNGEELSSFLFRRKGREGFGFIQTSSIIVNRNLIEKVVFKEELKKHQDWDFELRVDTTDAKILFINEALSIYHDDAPLEERVGNKVDYLFSMNWITEWRQIISNKVYVSFIINFVFPQILYTVEYDNSLKRKLLYEIYSSLSGVEKFRLYNFLKFLKFYIFCM